MKIIEGASWKLGCGRSATLLLAVILACTSASPVMGQSWPQISLTSPIGGFHHPTHLAVAHDGSIRLFVTEQSGVIRIIKNGSILDTPFLDITGRPGTVGDQGLLSVAFPPDFANKKHFYINYVTAANTLVVARYNITSDPDVADPNSEQIVLSVGPYQNSASHFGGELAFGPLDGDLYFGLGTGSGGAPNAMGQDTTVLFGKILRLDVETGNPATYTVPAGNPYATDPNARPEIWALGLRNPWRSSFDSQTGDFYIADVGENTREEVDFQPANFSGGANYGWDIMEGSLCFDATTCDTTGLTLPVAEYDHTEGCDISGGTVYRSARYPTFQGIYFYGDWCSGNIWGLQQINQSWFSAPLATTTLSVIAFSEDEDGHLWVADYSGGAIYSVVEGPPNPLNLSITEADSADPSRAGSPLTYTIQVKNNSAATATGVVINDTWTSGISFVSVSSDQSGNCSRSANTFTCRILSLAAGTTATITLVLNPSATGTVTNTASVNGNEPDPDTSDNSITENTTIITASPIQVTVQTTPSGVTFSVDGATFSAAHTFSWTPGSSHTIGTTSPQSAGTGARYSWNYWSDNGAISHTIAPTKNKTFTATFTKQYFLTMNAGSGGTVNPASGWQKSGSSVSISATPTNNSSVSYNFAGWTGGGTGSYSGNNNPATVTMGGPVTETASFSQNPIQVIVQTHPSGLSFSVDGTSYSAGQTFSWTAGSSHTIATTSPQSGGSGVRSVWSNWSDNGTISHSIAPTKNKTYTANFTTQYFLTTSAGTGGKVTPASGWKNSGANVSITATANSDYSFSGWSGTGTGSFSGVANPASVTMGGPINEAATFTHN